MEFIRARMWILAFAALAALPSAATQPPGWTHIHAGGDTGCAFDTPFSFFYREAPDPSALLIYFEGGGACWGWVSCSGMFDTNVSDDELSGFRGIFDFSNAANPFADHSVLFIPYCTGDVHIGDTIRHYGDSTSVRPVAHLGDRNVQAALTWVADTLDASPASVVISGTSAGSYGALFHAPTIAKLFPAARISVIGDSGVPLLNDYPEVLKGWGSSDVVRRMRGIEGEVTREDLTLERAHEYFVSRNPDALLAQVTSDRDAVQSAFYLISGSSRGRDATYALLDSLEATLPTFHAFVVAGSDHGLFVTDRFYSYAVADVRLADWVRRAISGDVVDGHRCAACR